MAPLNPIVRARLEKLLALAKGGTGGEKETAQQMLDRTMAELGITLDMLTMEEVRRVEFKFRTVQERDILMAVYTKVMDATTIRYGEYKGTLLFNMTRMQEVETGMLYDIYRRAWKKEQARALRAFIIANRIWHATDDPNAERPQRTPEQEAEAEEARRRARLITPETITKQIEGK